MVERGGLDYPIRVRDEFTKTLVDFRAELARSKKEFRDFQKILKGQRSSAKSIREQAQATRDLVKAQEALAKASRQVTKPLTDEEIALKQLAQQAQRQIQLERESVRLRKSQEADIRRRNAQLAREARAREAAIKAQERQARSSQSLSNRTNVEFQAQRRLTNELFRQRVALREITLLRAAAASQRAGGDIIGSEATLKRAQGLERSLNGSVRAGNQLFFTFRRLVGTLAIFTLARRGVQAFQDLVSEGVKFNDTIAVSELGIAGLVATLGDVRDVQGQSVSRTEELNLALGIARKQTALLRQDSLQTVATFGELLETFQVSVGPGLAAGLNLDEVRQLTVDISQAAAALGVPQNQLAEEVRSLLSGTIQARTTRIATALGISNEDIRRLKETGELFSFLEKEFSDFAVAAQRQARETFSGISTLITGIVQEILGNAARPLFVELLDLGNDLFDNLLTIRDEAGKIRPNPEVVEAFQSIFDALRDGVVAARELAAQIGVGGLQTALAASGFALQAIIGAGEVLVGLFGDILNIVSFIREQIGLTGDESGNAGNEFGKWATRLALANLILGKINTKLLATVKGPAIILAAFVGIVKALEVIFEKVTGIDLNLRDTLEIVAVTLLDAFFDVGDSIKEIGFIISDGFGSAIDFIVSKAKSGALDALGFIQSNLLLNDVAAQVFRDAAINERLELEKNAKIRKANAEVELADIRAQAAARSEGFKSELAEILGAAAARDNESAPGFDSGFDAARAAREAAEAAVTFVSTADKPISALGESLVKVNDEILKARQQFDQVRAGAGEDTTGISSAFDQQEVESAERLREIRASLAETDLEIARLREASGVSAEREAQIIGAINVAVEDRKQALVDLNVLEGEGGLVSALRDQFTLRNAILKAEGQSGELAAIRAATIATRIIPNIREESISLNAQVQAERAKTNAIISGAGSREMALIAARSALGIANQELQTAERLNALEQQRLLDQASQIPPGAERDALNSVIVALATRQGFEEEILRLRIAQLAQAEMEADMIANGSIQDGLRSAFDGFANQFSSQFNAGVQIATTALNGFTQFASQAIVDAFDPTKDADTIRQNFARLLQQISQVILQQLIELAIARLLIEAGFGGAGADGEDGVKNASAKGAIEISTATTVASIRLANEVAIAGIRAATGGAIPFSEGGQVPISRARGGFVPHQSRFAQGLARGGRPAHIPASDTVPAWLTPGEFVFSKKAVDSIGLSSLEAMNGGNMPIVGSASAEAAAPKVGMQTGGRVSAQNETRSSENNQPQVMVVPAIVARDRELDLLTNGGKNAMFAFFRENAGTIAPLLNRGSGR